MQLFINNTQVELGDNVIISFTKEDLSAVDPSQLTTPYSKSINLPRTPTNESVFGYTSTLQSDYSQLTFSPLKKAKAHLILDNGQSIVGYVHMDRLSNDQIECTFYSEFGDMFSELKQLYVGDLYSYFVSPIDMDQSVLVQHWNTFQTTSEDPAVYANWGYGLNWCPNYCGTPSNFQADKVVLYQNSDLAGEAYYPKECEDSDGNRYSTIDSNGIPNRRGFALFECPNELPAIAARDFRWYLQRPMISIRSFFGVCTDFVNRNQAIGLSDWRMELDASFFDSEYYKKGWIILPALTIDSNEEGDTEDEMLARGLLTRKYVDGTYKVKITPQIFCGWHSYTVLDLMINLTKRFGLVYIVQTVNGVRTLKIVDRKRLHLDYWPVVDLTNCIDESSITVEAVNTDTRYFNLVDEESKAADAELYKKNYKRPFGEYRIDTNNQFSKDEKDIVESIFSNAPSALLSSRYYRIFDLKSYSFLPPGVLDGDCEYKLYKESTAEEVEPTYTAASLNVGGYTIDDIYTPFKGRYRDLLSEIYYTPNKPGVSPFEMIEFQEKSDGAIPDELSLAFFNGYQTNSHCWYTSNDMKVMKMYNDDDSPWCWFSIGDTYRSDASYPSNPNYSIVHSIPYLSRYLYENDVIKLSMDYSVPKRLFVDKDKWDEQAAYNDDACIYEQYWKSWITDLYDQNTLKMSCTINPFIWKSIDLERLFACGGLFSFKGCYWRMASVDEYSIDQKGNQKLICSFIKVNDINSLK